MHEHLSDLLAVALRSSQSHRHLGLCDPAHCPSLTELSQLSTHQSTEGSSSGGLTVVLTFSIQYCIGAHMKGCERI